MDTLNDIMINTGSDKSSLCHHYTDIYEQYIGHFRNEEINLLELGVGGEDKEPGGSSLLAWQQYFRYGKISGIDIYDKEHLKPLGINIFKGSQDDRNFLSDVIYKIGYPDIIIDDASHFAKPTIESFRILFPYLKSGGWYIIEDLSCSYRWDFGGVRDIKDSNTPTIMNYLIEMLHNIHPVNIGISDFKKNLEFIEVESVHFHPDIVFIKKK